MSLFRLKSDGKSNTGRFFYLTTKNSVVSIALPNKKKNRTKISATSTTEKSVCLMYKELQLD